MPRQLLATLLILGAVNARAADRLPPTPYIEMGPADPALRREEPETPPLRGTIHRDWSGLYIGAALAGLNGSTMK